MKAGAVVKRERSAGWQWAVCLILIAFTLQSYVAQTHIHNLPSQAVTKIASHAPGKAPLDDNPLDCPFCQAVAHGGSFFVPASPLLILCVLGVSLAAPALPILGLSEAPAHIWQSRAPPHH